MSDPFYDQTVLFLPFEKYPSVPGVYSPEVVYDFSKKRRSMLVSQMPALPASPLVKYGDHAAYFNASGVYTNRYIRTTVDSEFTITGDFTIECWVYPFSIGATWGSFLLDTRNTSVTAGTGYYLTYGYSGVSGKVSFGNQVHAELLSNTTLTNNAWSHLAIVRSGSNVRMYINGVSQTQEVTYSGTYTATTFNLGVSANDAGTTGISGYVDEYRITLAARYTANFTPTQIDLADYPVPAFSPRVIQDHYNKSGFDFNALPKTKRVITDHYNKSSFDFNALAKAGRLIPVREKNSIRDWSALARVGRTCVEEDNARNDFKNAAFGSLNITTQGTISGIIKIFGSPVKRKVRLHESQSGAFVREMWSGDDGTYLFTGLRKELLYTITATDYAEQYNDVIGTNISPI